MNRGSCFFATVFVVFLSFAFLSGMFAEGQERRLRNAGGKCAVAESGLMNPGISMLEAYCVLGKPDRRINRSSNLDSEIGRGARLWEQWLYADDASRASLVLTFNESHRLVDCSCRKY